MNLLPAALRRHSPGRTKILFGLAAVVLALGTYAAGDYFWYRDRVARNVKVANLELGSLSAQQAEAAIGTLSARKDVTLQGADEPIAISREEVGAAVDVQATVSAAMEAGRGGWVPREVSVPPVIRIDQEKLNQKVKALAAAKHRAPVDATLKIEGENVDVVPERPGRELDEAALRRGISRAFSGSGSPRVSVAEKSLPARIKATDLQPLVAEAKASMGTPLTIRFQDLVFAPGPAEVGRWIVLQTPEGAAPSLTFDGNRIAVYVATLARQVDIMPVDRRVLVANGTSQLQAEGSDGQRMDQAALAKALRSAIGSRQALSYDIALLPAAKKTVTTTMLGPTSGRLIEISLARQRLWAWEDGKVVHEAPITSGASALGWPTITGKFAIQAKQRNRYLNGQSLGYNYNVFVKYWMPFSGNYGLHDAPWRGGKFGTMDYVRTGSHGCVNMPEATSAWLYNWASVGTAVVVHK